MPVTRGDRGPADRVQHRRDLAGDFLGQTGGGGIGGQLIDRVLPGGFLGRVGGFDHRPQVDAARSVVKEGAVQAVLAKALPGLARKAGIDGAQDRGRGAEGMFQVQQLHGLFDRCEGRAELRAAGFEDGNIGALKGIDRLLGIAHHEQRPHPVRGPGGEFRRQPFDDPPLLGRGILRLVHEDVVDAAIQSEQHPLCHGGVRQKRRRAGDQVIEIQPARGGFARLIAGAEGAGKAAQRQRAVDEIQRYPARPDRCHARHQVVQIVHELGTCALLQGLGRDLVDLGAERVLGVLAEQQRPFQHRKRRHIRRVPVHPAQLGRQIKVGLAAPRQRARQMRYPARFGAVEDLRQQVRFGKSCRQIRRAPDLGSVWVTVEIARGLRQQAVQPVARMDAGQVGHLGQVVLGHLLQHLGAQKGGTAVVQLGEAMGDAGLQREAAQKRGAEAVDRLHLQPARRFNRLREQAARGGQIGIAPRAQLRQRRAQGRVGQHCPFAKALQQAVLHLAGGGLGIGQA